MYKVFLRIFLILILTMALACTSGGGSTDGDADGDGGGGDGTTTELPSTVVLNNPKALFVATNQSSTSASVRDEDSGGVDPTLFQISDDETVEEVTFTDGNGNEIEMVVWSVKYLTEKYIALNITLVSTLEDAYLLIDIDTGQIYDFTDYALFSMTGDAEDPDFSAPAFFNGYFYMLGVEYEGFPDGTLYRIDMSTLEATPLNNPEALHVGKFYHIGDGEFLVYDDYATTMHVLHDDGSAPNSANFGSDEINDDFDGFHPLSELDSLSGGYDEDPIQLAYDGSGKLVDFDGYVDVGAKKLYLQYRTFSVDGAGDLVIDSEAIVDGDDTTMNSSEEFVISSNKLYDTKRIIVMKTVDYVDADSNGIIDPNDPNEYVVTAGYVTLEQGSDGWSYSSLVEKADLIKLLDLKEDNKTLLWKDTVCIYADGDYIRRWDITEPESSIEDFLPVADLVDKNRIYIIGDYLYYAKYVSATTIETWKKKLDGSEEAEMVSSSDMEIQSIVEFSL